MIKEHRTEVMSRILENFYNFPLNSLKCTLYGNSLILFYLYWQIDMVTSVGVPVSMPSTSKSNLLCKREAEVSIVKARVRVCPGSNLTVENASQGRLLMVIGRLTRTVCAYSPLFVTVKTIRLPPLTLNSACV